MKCAIFAAAIATLGLAGCDGAGQNQGTGFTGIGSEAASVTRVDRSFGADLLPGGALRADLPRRHVRSASANRLVQAELAIQNGGTFGRHAKKVIIGGQTLALSIVDVNATPYAVLRAPGMVFSPAINPVAGDALASQARNLTGCNADSRAYFYGAAPDRPVGLAVALNCFGATNG